MRCTARLRALLRSRLAADGPRLKAAENEIRPLKLALEQSPAAVVITGLDGTIEYVNTAFRKLTGYTTQEAVGSNIRVFKSGQHGPAFYQDLWQTILGGKVWRGRFQNRKKNGELFWENATIAPVFDAQGRITRFVAMKEDVTELMRTEQALQAAKLEAESAAQAKSAFLANMSHEIRTPLNAVLGFIHLLQDTGLTARQQDYLDKAGVSARRLHTIISDILDYSKIEAGRVDLETVPFDLRETLDKVAGILGHWAADKGLRLSFDLDPELPLLLLGDPVHLGQVLLNLGDNAVKFTEAGAVTFSARLLERAQGRVRLRFEVRDTGIGMTEAELGSLFQPFSQADQSTTRQFGGTGLGLAISRRLARLMGGDLEGASRAGQGSTFTLVLTLQEAIPGRPGRGRSKPATGATPLRGRTVLLVEDDKLNQQVAREILRRAGAGVGLAGNGREALERLGEQGFDGVVMDLQMPVMGGLEAARRIRRDPRWAVLPILALTADAVAGVRREVLAAGMNEVIAKPIDPALLVHTLSGLILEVDGAAARQAGQIQGVDLPGTLARLELDEDTYLRLLRRFAAGVEDELASMRAALAEGDGAGALRLAHSLKGASLNLGANAIGAAARELEEVLASGAAWQEPLERLQERLRELLESLALTPAAAEVPAAADWPAILAALAVLRQALCEDDAKAGQDLKVLVALLKGGPLQAALAPMKARIENYDYGRALELFPAFEASVDQARQAV